MRITFSEAIGGAMAVAATAAIVVASVVQGKAEAMTALVALSGAACGYFLRAKLSAPEK